MTWVRSVRWRHGLRLVSGGIFHFSKFQLTSSYLEGSWNTESIPWDSSLFFTTIWENIFGTFSMDTREKGWRVQDKVLESNVAFILTKTAEGMDFKPFYGAKRYQKTVDWTILDLLKILGTDFWFGRTRILEKQMVEPNNAWQKSWFTSPKTNMETEDDGLEKVDSFKIWIYVRFLGCIILGSSIFFGELW